MDLFWGIVSKVTNNSSQGSVATNGVSIAENTSTGKKKQNYNEDSNVYYLPIELWIVILRHFQYRVSVVMGYRRVCKSWNSSMYQVFTKFNTRRQLLRYSYIDENSSLSDLNRIEIIMKQATRMPNLQQIFTSHLVQGMTVLTDLSEIRIYASDFEVRDFVEGNLFEILTRLPSLTSLDVSHNRRMTLESLPNIPQLQSLAAYANRIGKVPSCLTEFSQLTRIDFNTNQITGGIPLPICLLGESLTDLNLSQNNLSEFGSNISKLHQLRRLNLAFNKITHLPLDITHLTHLRCLLLTQNTISEIPEEMFDHVSQLSHLDLSDNTFKTIPENITKLHRLFTLKLYLNQITSISDKITQYPFTNLRYVDVSGNPRLGLILADKKHPKLFPNCSQLQTLIVKDD